MSSVPSPFFLFLTIGACFLLGKQESEFAKVSVDMCSSRISKSQVRCQRHVFSNAYVFCMCLCQVPALMFGMSVCDAHVLCAAMCRLCASFMSDIWSLGASCHWPTHFWSNSVAASIGTFMSEMQVFDVVSCGGRSG